MDILESSEEIRKALIEVNPRNIAVACIGLDYRSFINPLGLDRIIISTTIGSNPNAIKHIVSEIGWDRVFLLDNLHAKMYLGGKSAIVTSANLSKNGLDVSGLLEIGVLIRDQKSLGQLHKVFNEFIKLALKSFPNNQSKEDRLKLLFDTYEFVKQSAVFTKYSFTFRKTIKRAHIEKNSKIIIPVAHHQILNKYLNLDVRESEPFQVFLPNNSKIEIKLYHGENNYTPSYYEFRASTSDTIELRDLFALGDQIEYRVNLENRTAIISHI